MSLSTNRNQQVRCKDCGTYMRSDHLQRHRRSKHPVFVTCAKCTTLVRETQMDNHRILCNDDVDFRLCGKRSEYADHLPACSESSVNGYFRCWKLKIEQVGNYDDMLDEVCERVADVIKPLLNQTPIKSQVTVQVCHFQLLQLMNHCQITDILRQITCPFSSDLF